MYVLGLLTAQQIRVLVGVVCRWLDLEKVVGVGRSGDRFTFTEQLLLQGHKQLPPNSKQQVFQYSIFLFFPYEAKLRSVSCCAAPAQSSFVSIILCAENTENTKVCRDREYREYKGEICPAARRKNCPTLIVREASRGPSLQSNMDCLRFQDF